LATSNWAAHAKVLHQPVHDFAIHPDQTQIAAANVEGRLSLGNLNDPSAWRTPEKIPILRIGSPGSLVFSPDGKQLACIDAATRHVLLVDTTTQAFTQLSSEKPYRANSIAFRSDGRFLAVACDDQDIVILDVIQPLEVRRIATPSRATFLCFQPQTSNLAGLVWDDRHAVTIWDAETGQQRWRLEGHQQPVHCLAYTSDGKRLITGGADRIVKIWDSESAEELLIIKPFQNTIWGLAVSDDSRRLLVQSGMPPDPSTITVLGGQPEQETD
jgi:WD40 repeat protein